MSFNLADILEAAGKLVVTLDQHPRGATALVVIVVAGATVALAWRFG